MIEYKELSEEIRTGLEENCETAISAEQLYKEIYYSDNSLGVLQLAKTYNVSINTIKRIKEKEFTEDEIIEMLGGEYDNVISAIGLVMDKIEDLSVSENITKKQKEKIYNFIVGRIKEEL